MRNRRSAFTLIELIIVIAIVGIVYYIGFEGFKLIVRPPAATLKTLAKTLRASPAFAEGGTLMCLDRCRTCYFRKNISENFEKIGLRTSLENSVVYKEESAGYMDEATFGRYDDHPICLSLPVYRGGILAPTVIKKEGKFYLIGGFSAQTRAFSSLSQANEARNADRETLTQTGAFF